MKSWKSRQTLSYILSFCNFEGKFWNKEFDWDLYFIEAPIKYVDLERMVCSVIQNFLKSPSRKRNKYIPSSLDESKTGWLGP